MTASPPGSSRPRIVEAAFWTLLTGAVLLVLGGLLAVTVRFDAVREATSSGISDEQLRAYVSVYRGVGVGCVLAGVGLGFLAGRTRTGDPRFRRATAALGIALTVVIVLMAMLTGIHPVALLGALPIIVGTVLLTRPSATEWFGGGPTGSDDGSDKGMK